MIASPLGSGRWWRALLLVIVTAVVIVLHAVATASTVAPLGPHMATYAVTQQSRLTIDLGPLGTVVKDLDIDVPVGLDVTLHEIPEDFTQVDVSGPLNELAADLNSYLRFFASPDDTFATVATGLVKDVGHQVLFDAVILALLIFVIVVIAGRGRAAVAARRVIQRAGSLSVLVIVIVFALFTTATIRDARLAPVTGSQAFAGTELAGIEVTGRLGSLLETYGVRLMNIYRSNEQFYQDANANLLRAWQARIALDNTIAPATADEEDDAITMVMVADLHCNFSMSPLITTLVEQSSATIVVHGGDATINGTAVEQTCVDSVVNAVPDSATMVFVGGNHDSELTSDQFEAAGAVVLRGQTVEVNNVSFLGDLDPVQTRVSQGSQLAGEETTDEFAQRISTTACEQDPDIVLVHTPYFVEQTLTDGCAAYSLSGHLHRRVGPQIVGQGVEYVNSSTAGAVSGQPTVGPLHGTAEMTVLRYDPEGRIIKDYRIVAIRPDGSASVGPALAYPKPPLRQASASPYEDSQIEPEPAPNTTEPTHPRSAPPSTPATTDESAVDDPGTGSQGLDNQ